MNEEEVQVDENSEPVEPSDPADSEPVTPVEEVTYSVLVTNFDEIAPYQELQIALDCMIVGLLLVVIIALNWVKHL